MLEYFLNVDVYFINRYLTVWGFTIVFPHFPLFQKNVRFFHSFVDSCIWTICHHKDFTGRVLLRVNFISPRNNLFHTQKDFFWQGTDPQMGPICSEWYSQSDRRKILEPPWSVLDTTPWPENPGYRIQVWDNGVYFPPRERMNSLPLKYIHYCPACGTSDLGLTASVPLLLWWDFSFYLGFRARNRSLVEMFLCINFVLSPDQIMISHMNRWLSSRMMWYILASSHHWYSFKSQKYIARNLKYKLIAHSVDARLHVESHSSQAADILNGSTANIR